MSYGCSNTKESYGWMERCGRNVHTYIPVVLQTMGLCSPFGEMPNGTSNSWQYGGCSPHPVRGCSTLTLRRIGLRVGGVACTRLWELPEESAARWRMHCSRAAPECAGLCEMPVRPRHGESAARN